MPLPETNREQNLGPPLAFPKDTGCSWLPVLPHLEAILPHEMASNTGAIFLYGPYPVFVSPSGVELTIDTLNTQRQPHSLTLVTDYGDSGPQTSLRAAWGFTLETEVGSQPQRPVRRQHGSLQQARLRELPAAVSCQMWVLWVDLWSSARANNMCSWPEPPLRPLLTLLSYLPSKHNL